MLHKIKCKRIRKELNFCNLNDKIINYRNDWKYHYYVLRIDVDRFRNMILVCSPKGQRDVGLPVCRWKYRQVLLDNGKGKEID